jgi:hypothetical protein
MSHARIYDMLIASGLRSIHETNDPFTKQLYKDELTKVYNFVADEFVSPSNAQLPRWLGAINGPRIALQKVEENSKWRREESRNTRNW